MLHSVHVARNARAECIRSSSAFVWGGRLGLACASPLQQRVCDFVSSALLMRDTRSSLALALQLSTPQHLNPSPQEALSGAPLLAPGAIWRYQQSPMAPPRLAPRPQAIHQHRTPQQRAPGRRHSLRPRPPGACICPRSTHTHTHTLAGATAIYPTFPHSRSAIGATKPPPHATASSIFVTTRSPRPGSHFVRSRPTQSWQCPRQHINSVPTAHAQQTHAAHPHSHGRCSVALCPSRSTSASPVTGSLWYQANSDAATNVVSVLTREPRPKRSIPSPRRRHTPCRCFNVDRASHRRSWHCGNAARQIFGAELLPLRPDLPCTALQTEHISFVRSIQHRRNPL